MIHRLLMRRRDDARSETIWLTVYADLITNLMLLFLTLFGLTMMGNDALQQALRSMRLSDIYDLPDVEKTIQFEDIAVVLREEFRGMPSVQIIEEPGVVRVEFGENILFQSGQAVLTPAAAPVLVRLAKYLKIMPTTVAVEGHTDPVPLKTTRHFRDNWELSLARSMSVVELLMKDGGLDPRQLAAAAYGPYRPIASNETAYGRQLNRRVEIAMFKAYPFGETPRAVPIISTDSYEALRGAIRKRSP